MRLLPGPPAEGQQGQQRPVKNEAEGKSCRTNAPLAPLLVLSSPTAALLNAAAAAAPCCCLLRPPSLPAQVLDPAHRKHLVFQGASVLADIMKGEDDFWISRQEYEEDPARALARCGKIRQN